MASTHGFNLVWEKDVPECRSVARMWRHEATGAELLSFLNADENKVFGVSFRTPPDDSTGLPHILEHSVLCGSKKYPVKEPFVELLKGSLQTFLNAFTYPDKTCYPVASANVRDFRNLTDVYLDAVFFPLIPEEVFLQEGWHLEPGPDGNIVFKGVVYNEMKGVFSSPDSILSRYSLHSLFPDTVYGLESGGDPEVIPDLTYEQFMAFHRAYYHPSNARFFFWGDDDENERLAQVDAAISGFGRGESAPEIGLQPRLGTPVTMTIPFAAGEDENKGLICCNWLLEEVDCPERNLAFRMLDHILLGMPASPLRRALIESGLGEDITGGGLEDELRQSSFSVGLRGIDPQDAHRVEALILETLRDLAENGIDPKSVEAAVNTVEFALREKNSGRFPVGLAVMLQALTTWLHGGDPLEPLCYEQPLAMIKETLASGEPLFETLIRRFFLDNTHRSTVLLLPDAGLGEKQIEEEAGRVRSALEALSESERAELEARAERLRHLQEAPDDPELLARIPRLAVQDLPVAEKPIPAEEAMAGSAPVLFHPLPTSGISYVEAYFDLSMVPSRLYGLLPMFGRALTEMGTRTLDFVALNMAIASRTGGIDASPFFLTARADGTVLPRFVVSGKTAPDTIRDLFSLMEDIILNADFTDQERFLRMVLEEKARLEHSLVPAGHTFVCSRLKSAQSRSGMMEETASGITQLLFLRDLAERAAGDWSSVLSDMRSLRSAIFSSTDLAWNLTGEAGHREVLIRQAEELTSRLARERLAAQAPMSRAKPKTREAFLIPAQVNYVGRGGNLYAAGYRYHGSVHVILKQLRTGWLWEKIRVQGGAYGAFCQFDRMTGSFVLASYRDPNVSATLEVFEQTAQYLQKADISRRELDAAIIGAIGEMDTHLLPDAKGTASFIRKLTGDTPAFRQQMRKQILGTTIDHFRELAAYMDRALAFGPVCVIGGEKLEKTAAEPGWTATTLL